jgi:uncharacterized membrane protein
VLRRSSTSKVRHAAAVAQPYAERVVTDPKLRGHAMVALASALRARSRLLASAGLAGLVWRLANDPALQAEFQRVGAELRELGRRGERERLRRRRRRRLIAGGVALAGVAAAAAASRVARRSAPVEQAIEVDVPVTTAYNQWTQFEEFPRFMDGVDRVEQLDDTTLHWVVSFGGKRHEFNADITEQRPDERVAWTTTRGKRHAGVVTFHRLGDDRSRIFVQMEWEPEGLYERVGGFLGIDRRRVKGDLRRFKELIETRREESGAWRGEVEHGEVVPG